MLRLAKMTNEDWQIFNGRNFYGSRALGNAQEVVVQFYDSNEPVMRVVWNEGEYKNCESVRATLLSAIKALDLHNSVKIKVAKNRVYIYCPEKIKEIKL